MNQNNRKKNPRFAVIASFVFPGLGQIYNGERRKGIGFILIGTMFASLWIFLMHDRHIIGPVLVAGGAYILFWISNIYDAYKTVKEANML